MDEFRPVPDKFRRMFCNYYNRVKGGCAPIEAGAAAAEIYDAMCKHFSESTEERTEKDAQRAKTVGDRDGPLRPKQSEGNT